MYRPCSWQRIHLSIILSSRTVIILNRINAKLCPSSWIRWSQEFNRIIELIICLQLCLDFFHIILKVRIICFCAIGKKEDILKGFTFDPSVTEIILFDTFVTVKALSHFAVSSLYIRTRSPESDKYLVACGNFYCTTLCIGVSATMVSIYVLSSLIALNISFCFVFML